MPRAEQGDLVVGAAMGASLLIAFGVLALLMAAVGDLPRALRDAVGDHAVQAGAFGLSRVAAGLLHAIAGADALQCWVS